MTAPWRLFDWYIIKKSSSFCGTVPINRNCHIPQNMRKYFDSIQCSQTLWSEPQLIATTRHIILILLKIIAFWPSLQHYAITQRCELLIGDCDLYNNSISPWVCVCIWYDIPAWPESVGTWSPAAPGSPAPAAPPPPGDEYILILVRLGRVKKLSQGAELLV